MSRLMEHANFATEPMKREIPQITMLTSSHSMAVE